MLLVFGVLCGWWGVFYILTVSCCLILSLGLNICDPLKLVQTDTGRYGGTFMRQKNRKRGNPESALDEGRAHKRLALGGSALYKVTQRGDQTIFL